jgi:phenylacetate-CoA ligase
MGRSEDLFIVRAVNIFPSHIEEILARHGALGTEYRVVLDRARRQGLHDHQRGACPGRGQGERCALARSIATDVRKSLLYAASSRSSTTRACPETGSKAKRIFDRRDA